MKAMIILGISILIVLVFILSKLDEIEHTLRIHFL